MGQNCENEGNQEVASPPPSAFRVPPFIDTNAGSTFSPLETDCGCASVSGGGYGGLWAEAQEW